MGIVCSDEELSDVFARSKRCGDDLPSIRTRCLHSSRHAEQNITTNSVKTLSPASDLIPQNARSPSLHSIGPSGCHRSRACIPPAAQESGPFAAPSSPDSSTVELDFTGEATCTRYTCRRERAPVGFSFLFDSHSFAASRSWQPYTRSSGPHSIRQLTTKGVVCNNPHAVPSLPAPAPQMLAITTSGSIFIH